MACLSAFAVSSSGSGIALSGKPHERASSSPPPTPAVLARAEQAQPPPSSTQGQTDEELVQRLLLVLFTVLVRVLGVLAFWLVCVSFVRASSVAAVAAASLTFPSSLSLVIAVLARHDEPASRHGVLPLLRRRTRPRRSPAWSSPPLGATPRAFPKSSRRQSATKWRRQWWSGGAKLKFRPIITACRSKLNPPPS
eukprot:CAMPEP_0206131228 /NCGR_PEP_ID=MMETSP1472-20131121/44303_1 /ASSEMBLY_ACC=CAM_ASM_001108 /TAXON_ID=41880 /ORGANISM="Pycnococcus provasolii, Strain RCC251" /LENGTH=194 /DNA_ID=CAMNT_0053522657 /DNA_START=118 /DNA_END=704 /DNA_ORIENTATION=+